MTWSISHVTTALSATAPDRLEKDISGWYLFTVMADAGTEGPASVNYDYTLQDDIAILSFVVPPGTREIAIGSTDTLCWVNVDGVLGEGLRLHDEGGYRQMEVPEAITASGGQVDCNLPPRLRQDSFTTFASIFQNDPRGRRTDIQDRIAMPIELTFNRREGSVEIAASSKAVLGDMITLSPGGFVAARFQSMHMGEVRDWYILVIGVLVGFGAAMIIEAFRPLIERIGTRPSARSGAGSRP